MNKQSQWDDFLSNLLTDAQEDLKATTEYEYRSQRQDQIDELLGTTLTKDQKTMVEEVLYEFGLAEQRETQLLYRQGFTDCVWLLRTLGVLS